MEPPSHRIEDEPANREVTLGESLLALLDGDEARAELFQVAAVCLGLGLVEEARGHLLAVPALVGQPVSDVGDVLAGAVGQLLVIVEGAEDGGAVGLDEAAGASDAEQLEGDALGAGVINGGSGDEVAALGEEHAVEHGHANQVERVRLNLAAVVGANLVEAAEDGHLLNLTQEAGVGPGDVELYTGDVLRYVATEQPDARPPAVGPEGGGDRRAVGAEAVDGVEGGPGAGEVLLEDHLGPAVQGLGEHLVGGRS